ncbi:MAG: O-antigen ligase family protein [Oscillospiraceae bacterium]|nr:O-antigen ligase family protein [Oscillospiraceae bacterium]
MPKTIFGTSEKSNFILNMKYTTVRKWIIVLLCACIIVPLIGGMVITGIDGTSSLLGSFLYATGFSCILFYIVLLLRKDITFKNYPAAFLIIGLAVLAFASYYRAALNGASQEDINTLLLGETGRYEGLLALFAYFGIFLLATAVMKYSSVRIVFDVLIGAGIVQAIVAVMQHIPWSFPSDFRKLPAIVLLKDVHLSSGLSDSPIFYGSFLTLVTAVAISGAIYEKNILRARIYGASSVLFFLTGLFTSSVVPLIGIGTALVVTIIIELTAGRKETKFDAGILKSSGKRLAAIILSFAAVFGIVAATQGINIYDINVNTGAVIYRDKSIAYSDAYYRLFIVGGPSPITPSSHWEIGAERSINMIKEHPLLGVGPDMMAKKQLQNEYYFTNSIDRSYNEYLYAAATRGIPSLVVYLALLGVTIYRLVKNIKLFASNREMWFRPALLTAIIAYSVQAYFSVSAVTVAPFFWLLLGISHSKFTDEK